MSFKPNHLLADELDYELRIRGTVTERNQNDKRKILTRLLARQTPNTELSDPTYSFAAERNSINTSLESITTIIIDFEGSESDSCFKRISSRLIHLTERLNRLKIDGDDREIVIEFKNESLATCLTLEGDLFERVEQFNKANSLNQSQVESPAHFNGASNFVPTNYVSTPKSIPVYKWNIKFNGDSRALYPFLEKVEEYSVSRGVSDEELFSSAVDLFENKAFMWYKTVRQNVRNWGELVTLLKQRFLPPDYEEEIWEDIRLRKQGRNESVIIYIAVMETLFNRLNRIPAEVTKVKYIRHNLLPNYVNQLALVDINTMTELSNICKKLEDASFFKNKLQEGKSRKSLLEPELSYIDNEVLAISEQKPSFNGPKQRNKSNFSPTLNSKVVCWNCKQPNHRYDSCTAKKTKFCFKCGMQNHTVATCPNCTKNQ